MPTPFVIPTETGSEVAPQTLRVVLDGTAYQLALQYNARYAVWRCDIQDDAGNAIAAGLAVRNAGIPVNGAVFGRRGFPIGALLAIASAQGGSDADNSELGGRVLLTYQAQA